MHSSPSSQPEPHRRGFAELSRIAGPLLAGVLLAGALAACGSDSSQRSQSARQQATDLDWAWLQKEKGALDEKRGRLEAAGDANPKETATLRTEVDREASELNRRLVAFLNAEPPVAGEPLSPRQKSAVRMKSDEDILIGRGFIEKGGDYQRAIEVYEAALGLDPGYDRLQAELQEAQARRYVSRDGFDEVKEGMSEDEVRQILGQPNLHNVREYPEHDVVGWFYPKDETGAAAGIWFEKAAGALKVYRLDFEAIRPHAPAPDGPPVT